MVVVVSALVSVAAQSALAGHGHTVAGVHHGLGDGWDDDYRSHPFNHSERFQATHNVSLGRKGRGYFRRVRHHGAHAHIEWDTSNIRECYFYSYHSANGRLNGNAHPHHYDCR